MEEIVVKSVKTEVLSNGGILLYYVDENGETQEGILNTIEEGENDEDAPIQENSYILDNFEDLVENEPIEETNLDVSWTDDDIKRLLLFFNDNKSTFISGVTQKRHLWAVACKTMLIGKDQKSCETQLNELKQKYCEVRDFVRKGVYVKWPFFDLCHQAFHDDPIVIEALNDKPVIPKTETNQYEGTESTPKIAILKYESIKDSGGTLAIKQVNVPKTDVNVEKMLNLYLKYKENFQKEHWRRDLWEKIGKEMGEQDSEYLQKRFLNYKQHYINMLIKEKETNSQITWPYMALFDKIYSDDAIFHKKYFNVNIKPQENSAVPEHEWNDVQRIVLAKYYYDCYDEFADITIPRRFLWSEVGRLIEKKPDSCEVKYNLLRREHLENFISENYNLSQRKPISIIFDSIIVRDVKNELRKSDLDGTAPWDQAEIDELVQFMYDKMELFKDKDCHLVCWAAIAHKLKRTIIDCKNQWDELVIVYKSILEDKKENSEMQIDWRYIELFDRIFDYGMDANLMKDIVSLHLQDSRKINVKQVVFKKNPVEEISYDATDDSDLLESSTDPHTTKILEHYLKNKDKFQTARNKLNLWDHLSRKIGITTSQCAQRFKTIKQTYINYIKKEIETPKTIITWPHFALCKKVFGYRLIKNKLKQGILESDNDDWLAREIKLLITHFSNNFNKISNNIEDVSVWGPLATKLGKSESYCKDKFVELRKCYRKLKTMRSRNPDVKISWSYFDMFERIYTMKDETMEVEALDEEQLLEGVEEMEQGGDDDYQCIIVLQEGQELPADLSDAQIIIQQPGDNIEQILNMTMNEETNTESLPTIPLNTSKWTKRAKKRLLINYINYVRSHRGQEIKSKEMWAEIAMKFPNKKPVNCQRIFHKMKNNFKESDETAKTSNPLASLLRKVIKLKPKFAKSENTQQEKVYKDVEIESAKVFSALAYYLKHIEEFVNPMFEKKYLWNQLAHHINEPVTKIYNKINYLKQAYNIETEEIDGQITEYSALLKEIISKEVAVKIVLDVNPTPEFTETNWSDDEIEQLMIWYLSNLDKFKNPKFNKSYLWMEASTMLSKSPLVCSKKMSEVRTLYRNMVKENPEGLQEWRFFELCQKIYGTGRRASPILDTN